MLFRTSCRSPADVAGAAPRRRRRRRRAASATPALGAPEGGLGGHDPRLDRVVDSLQGRHVDETRAFAREQEAGRVEAGRQRVVAALGDRLRAPRRSARRPRGSCARAGASSAPGARRGPRTRRRGTRPGDEAERDHVVAHRIDEGAAELAVARPFPRRPAHRVDDATEHFATFHTSLAPSAQSCGCSPARPKRSIAAPVR